jgi:MFS family permease
MADTTLANTNDDALQVHAQGPSGTFAAMSVPNYPRLWVTGLLWNLTRWMAIFLSTYLVNHLTHSAFYVQLVGSFFFAPMFLGGAVAGVISDRLDRRRTILIVLTVLSPLCALMGALIVTDVIATWMVYPFMLAIGVSMVLDMTSRRALVYDFVGPEHVTNALALESLAQTGGSLLGGLVAGAIVTALGIGETFFLVAIFYALAFVTFVGVPMPPRKLATVRTNFRRDIGEGVRYVRGHVALISILGVTIIMNTFHFSFMTMVPVFADRLEVNALLTGILASAMAGGSMIGTLFIARGLPFGRGMAYVGGSMTAMAFLFIFATVSWYPLALLALVLAGVASSGFGTMQSALVMSSADDEMRGRALGLLSMGIGALPFSMLLLGIAAQLTSPPTAVMGSVSIGFACMIVWNLWRPESRRLP